MMKKAKWIAIIFVVASIILCANGCANETEPPHEHKFAAEWTYNAENHWHEATCEHTNEVSEKSAHTFGEYVSNNDATPEADGTKTRECSVCGYKDTVKDEGSKNHTHTYSAEWTYDTDNHWHKATCEHTSEVSDKAAHTFGEYVSNNDATPEADGTKTRECSVCKYKDTVKDEGSKIHVHTYSAEWTYNTENHWHEATCEHTEERNGEAAHTFGEYVSNNDATTEADGTKTRECSVCKYEDTVKDEGSKIHVHTYSAEWTYDAENHWHEATCKHTSEVSDKAAHTLEWEITKNPTETEVGEKKGTCSVCGYETSVVTLETVPTGFVYVLGTTITGTETWEPTSEVFISGRQLTIRDLIVSDHEVTRDEYKEVIGKDPSTASAYKGDIELTGDDVLNNPVNYVSWYDAIVYCNKLSIQENLTPCYSIENETDPEESTDPTDPENWGDVPTSNSSTWNAVTCDFEANGYRLPTEAEWEWLARGGENYTYAGSNTIDEVAWVNPKIGGTREVKTKASNGYGLYDMSGNVYEWCWDWYEGESDSPIAYGAEPVSFRRLRGGCWGEYENEAKVNYRNYLGPYYRHLTIGFRVVRSSTND